MIRWRHLVRLRAVGLGLTLAACGLTAPDAAPASAPVVAPIAIARATPTAAAARYVGVVTATESIELAPTVEAALIAVAVGPGDEVSAGQVIAELDPRAVRRDLAIGAAALAEVTAGRRAADVEVRDAARVLASELRAVEAGVSPRRAVEDARAGVQRARAGRDRADAAVTEARARVAALEVLVDDTTIRAPFAGVVALRYREVGDVAGPRTPVVRLNKRDGLRLRFGVPPNDARRLRPGMRVVAQVDTLSAPIDATIEHVAPDVDAPSRLIFVDATLASAADGTALQPGLAAHVSLP